MAENPYHPGEEEEPTSPAFTLSIFPHFPWALHFAFAFLRQEDIWGEWGGGEWGGGRQALHTHAAWQQQLAWHAGMAKRDRHFQKRDDGVMGCLS